MLRPAALVFGLVFVAAGAGLCSLPAGAQPAPPVYAYPVLYRDDHGRWERSLLFEPGDRVRFVMPFFTPQPGWSFPRGTFFVQRERVPFYAQPVIFKHVMGRRHAKNGYTIFSISFQMQGRRWLGHWIAEPSVTNGRGLTEPEFYFTVLPHLPLLYSVADAIALCRSRPRSRQTILIGGVWGETIYFVHDTATGWIAARWAGRGFIPHWWEHGVLRLIFPPAINPEYRPPDGFLQVRSSLDCRTHTLIAVAHPVIA